MAGLDFRRAADLFVSTERELGMALGITAADVGRYRRQPEAAPPEIMARLGTVLVERAMANGWRSGTTKIPVASSRRSVSAAAAPSATSGSTSSVSGATTGPVMCLASGRTVVGCALE